MFGGFAEYLFYIILLYVRIIFTWEMVCYQTYSDDQKRLPKDRKKTN